LRGGAGAHSIGAFLTMATAMRWFSLDDWSERQTALFVILMGLVLYIPFAG